MKSRNGFVSNSSSSSFILDVDKLPKDLLSKIYSMTERSDDCSRCTGVIKYVDEWLNLVDEGNDYDIRKYIEEGKNIIIVRESDEEMGGSFSDYDFTWHDLEPYTIREFEYH